VLNAVPDLFAPRAGRRAALAVRLQRHRRRRLSSDVLATLADIANCVALFEPDPATMGFTGASDMTSWAPAFGSLAYTANYFAGVGPRPQFDPYAFGYRKPGVFFRGSSLEARALSMTWTNATFVLVGRMDLANLTSAYPRWLGLEHFANGWQDWNTAQTISPFDYDVAGHNVADSYASLGSFALPVSATLPNLMVCRKVGAVITGWVKPAGGSIVTASSDVGVGAQALNADRLSLGGSQWLGAGTMLFGWIGMAGVWGRGLSDAEVSSVFNHLTRIYG